MPAAVERPRPLRRPVRRPDPSAASSQIRPSARRPRDRQYSPRAPASRSMKRALVRPCRARSSAATQVVVDDVEPLEEVPRGSTGPELPRRRSPRASSRYVRPRPVGGGGLAARLEPAHRVLADQRPAARTRGPRRRAGRRVRWRVRRVVRSARIRPAATSRSRSVAEVRPAAARGRARSTGSPNVSEVVEPERDAEDGQPAVQPLGVRTPAGRRSSRSSSRPRSSSRAEPVRRRDAAAATRSSGATSSIASGRPSRRCTRRAMRRRVSRR